MSFRFPHSSIRNRLLTAFLFFSAVIVLMSVLSFIYLTRGEAIQEVRYKIDKLNQQSLHLMKMDVDFFNVDLLNESFYATGTTPSLEAHDELLAEILIGIDALLQNTELNGFKVEDDLYALQSELHTYNNTYKLTLSKLRERGFRDFGKIGDMRVEAHRLQELRVLPEADVLTLRRHEKDYLLRNDPVYVQKFNTHAQQVLQGIGNSPTAQQARATLLAYQQTFNELVPIRREIGLENQTGLKFTLNELNNSLVSRFDALSAQANARMEVMLSRVRKVFWASLIISIILSVGFSLYLANGFSRPIRKLSETMDQIVLGNFSQQVRIDVDSNTEEVNRLQATFQNMVDQIRRQLAEISEKGEELRMQNEKLVEINHKLSSSEQNLKETNAVKDKFFSIIAHDLKGPIATSTAFLELLIKYSDGLSKEETNNLAREMFKSMNNLSSLLENLLEWSRSQMGRVKYSPSEVPLRYAVKKNLELLGVRANDKKIRLITMVDPELNVWADRNMLDFILRNLISNAVKFTSSGGTVEVSAHVHEHEDIVQVAVTDNGVGISEEDRQALFKPEMHLTRHGTANEKGTGLGLLLCKEFVEKHDGKIWVESALGQGTSFLFTIGLHSTLVGN